MSYFAEVDATKKVLRVIVADSAAWPQSVLGGTWIETSMSDPAQMYAGIGMYDAESIAPPRFIPQWRQPLGSHDAYENGAWCWHSGKAWRSLQAANVFQPGVSSWREMLTEWPEWIQPNGATVYQIGEKITFKSKRYISKINNNSWSPEGYPAGWQIQP